VDETEHGGVKCQAPGCERVAPRIAIDLVAEHRVSQVGEMDPNLVRPARGELRFDERGLTQRLHRPERCTGRAAATVRERGAPRLGAGTANTSHHDFLLLEDAAGQDEVAPVHRVGAELAVEVLGGAVREREDEHARGIAVESVHDKNAVVAARAALDLGGGARKHRVLLAVDRRVNEEPCRLDHHDHVVIQVRELDRRRGRRPAAARGVGPMVDVVRRPNQGARFHLHAAIDEDVAHLDLALGVRVRAAEVLLDDTAEAPHHRFHAPRLAPRDEEFACRCDACWWTPARLSR